MPRPKQTDDGLTKPDPNSPEFAAEAKRQGMLLRGRPEETDALEFIASAFAWPEP